MRAAASRRVLKTLGLGLGAAVLVSAVLLRAGITRRVVARLGPGDPAVGRPIQLRVWDWWSASANEEYGRYFEDLERRFEARHADVNLIFQVVPFGNYVQKLSTAMVGRTPPDVFQSSVYWAEGFYQRGMLRPLNDLLEAHAAEPGPRRVTRDAFLPSAWRHNQTDDGVIFGIPQIIDANCLLWNLDLLQQAADDDEVRAMFARRPDGSVDFERIHFDAIRDWDHFRRIARKLTTYGPDGQVQTGGFVIHAYGGGAGMFSPWLAANGGRYQDSAGTRALFASRNGVQAMRFLAELYWKDRVCPPFRRQLAPVELFQEGRVAAMVAGTWSGKDIMRNTQGWGHFGKTAFPPGPLGTGQRTVTWGNMLVVTQRCRHVDAAWRYIQFVCGLEGNLLRLEHLGYNGPRLDFYETPQWSERVRQRPYLSNVKSICLVGDKLRHTEIIAVNHQANPVLETLLLRFPAIEAGSGPYASVDEALSLAAANVDRVFDRYNRQVARWISARAARSDPDAGPQPGPRDEDTVPGRL